MPQIPTLWYFDTSVTYPLWFHRIKFVVIPHVLYDCNICEILLYNRHELINGCSPLGEQLLWNRSIAVDDLATQGTRASVAIALTWFGQNILVPAPEALINCLFPLQPVNQQPSTACPRSSRWKDAPLSRVTSRSWFVVAVSAPKSSQ